MNAVLQRELVVQARQRRTFWLRFLAGLALALVLGVQLFSLDGLARAMGVWRAGPTGPALFASLHTVVSLLLFFTAPLIAADSIARERREGTLGLLALTPLRPFEIVIGKVGAHILRLVSLWLVSLPVLMVPVLMGGVNWVDVKCALAVELSILCGGLGAGLIATSVAKRWNTAAVLALGLTFVFGQFVVTTSGLAIGYLGSGKPGIGSLPSGIGVWLAGSSLIPWAAATGLMEGGFGPMLANKGAFLATAANYVLLGSLTTTAGILLASVAIAGWRVQRVLTLEAAGVPAAKGPPPGLARIGLLRGVRDFQRRRWLALNPARWLFAYSPFSGWVRWGWLAAVLISGGLAPLLLPGDDWMPFVMLQPIVLAIGASLAAAASFRREIEEGTLELLLVTGLPARQLVSGRIRQLWADIAPALGLSALLMASMLGLRSLHGGDVGELLVPWGCGALSVLGAVPIGVRYAVRRLNPLHGWFWTVLTTGFPPLLIGGATATMFWGLRSGANLDDALSLLAYVAGFGATQFGLARTWFWLSANDLHTRRFMLKPFQRRPS